MQGTQIDFRSTLLLLGVAIISKINQQLFPNENSVGFIIACWIFPGFGSEPFILVANRKSVITSSCSLLWRTPSKLGEYVMSRFDSHSLTL